LLLILKKNQPTEKTPTATTSCFFFLPQHFSGTGMNEKSATLNEYTCVLHQDKFTSEQEKCKQSWVAEPGKSCCNI